MLMPLASTLDQSISCNIHIEFLEAPSNQTLANCTTDHSAVWMDPIFQFLQNETLPANLAEARHI